METDGANGSHGGKAETRRQTETHWRTLRRRGRCGFEPSTLWNLFNSSPRERGETGRATEERVRSGNWGLVFFFVLWSEANGEETVRETVSPSSAETNGKTRFENGTIEVRNGEGTKRTVGENQQSEGKKSENSQKKRQYEGKEKQIRYRRNRIGDLSNCCHESVCVCDVCVCFHLHLGPTQSAPLLCLKTHLMHVVAPGAKSGATFVCVAPTHALRSESVMSSCPSVRPPGRTLCISQTLITPSRSEVTPTLTQGHISIRAVTE